MNARDINSARAFVRKHGRSDAAWANEMAALAAEKAAGLYVLGIAHPTLPREAIMAQTVDLVFRELDAIVTGTLLDFGWEELVAEQASQHAANLFRDRVAEMLDASPTNAGGRA